MTIIEACCLLNGVSREEFFGRSTTKRIVTARKMAIDGMRAKGLSVDAIARLVKRNRSTVQYWVYPGIHERRISNYLKRLPEKEGIAVPPVNGDVGCMRDRIFHWVRHADLNDWILCGWVFAPCNEPMHHHEYSFMMEWLCDCPMRKPR